MIWECSLFSVFLRNALSSGLRAGGYLSHPDLAGDWRCYEFDQVPLKVSGKEQGVGSPLARYSLLGNNIMCPSLCSKNCFLLGAATTAEVLPLSPPVEKTHMSLHHPGAHHQEDLVDSTVREAWD